VSVAADLRYAVRMLARNRTTTIVALVCVSLGAGGVTTIFSAMNAVVLRPLPGAAEQDRLVDVLRRSPDGREGAQASYALYERLSQRSTTLQGIAAWSKVELAIGVDGTGHAVYGNIVSANYFSVLGVRPEAGRFFDPGAGMRVMGAPFVVVSDGFWRSALGADPAAIGKAVTVNGRAFTVIGVAPPEFRGAFTPLKVDAWVPLSMQPALRPGRDLTRSAWLWTFGRLAPGVTRGQAAAELSAIVAAHAAETTNEPDGVRGYTSARVTPMTGLPEDARTAFLGFAGIFLAASLLVLVIACVNVAAMLTARAVARERELAVRAALGATRGRLARQLLTEAVLLFGLGACGAAAVAALATSALERLPIPGDTPLLLELSPDVRVLAFALLLSLVTGILFGVGPAYRASRADATAPLRTGSAPGGTRRRVLTRLLIAGQLALSLVLLVGAGLFLRALAAGARTDPGFQPQGVTVTSLNTEAWGYDAGRGRAFYQRLRAALHDVPGVIDVSAATIVPLTMSGSGGEITLHGQDGEQRAPMRSNFVDPGYFATLRIPLLAGRDFGPDDDAASLPIAIVSGRLAKRFGGAAAALGRTFTWDRRYTIIGVAADTAYSSLDESAPEVAFFPLAQHWTAAQTVFVRSDAPAVEQAVARVIQDIDPLVPRPTTIPMEQATAIAVLPQRAAAWVTGALGTFGLLLAAVGLYGMMDWSASRRRQEVGIRMALGATRKDILRLLLGDGLRLAGLGLAAGLVVAALATRIVASLLFGVSPLDPIAFAGMALVFLGVAGLACYLPARRAAGNDPARTLRAE
jgi:predicted permease